MTVHESRTHPPAFVSGKLYWYRCHNCGWEAWISDGVRSSIGCGNSKCYRPTLHIHSNADGEKPKTLKVPE